MWSADIDQTGFIQRLEPGTAILTECVKDMAVEKPGGITKALWDYSIDMIGPGERARQADAFLACHERVLAHMEEAAAALDEAEPLVPPQNGKLFESQAWPTRWLYHSARTQVNFSRSCMLRDELAALATKKSPSAEDREQAAALLAQWREVLEDELANVREAKPIPRKDVRLDCYFRGDHMFNHLWDMVDAKEALLEKEIAEVLPTVAKRCGVTG